MNPIITSTFSFIKINDSFKLKSLHNINELSYSLVAIVCDEEEILIQEGTILPLEEVSFSLLKDAYYKLKIGIDVVYFNTWSYIRAHMIMNTKKLLCNSCGCCDGNLTKECINAILIQNSMSYMLPFITNVKDMQLTKPVSSNLILFEFIQRVVAFYKCDINKELCSNYADVAIKGYNTSPTIIKLYIACLYLCTYTYEKYLIYNNDADAIISLNNTYDIDSVLFCIKKLGINIKDIEVIFLEVITVIPTPPTFVHISNIAFNSDFATKWFLRKSPFILNFFHPLGEPIYAIKFLNLDEVLAQGNFVSVNNILAESDTEYIIADVTLLPLFSIAESFSIPGADVLEIYVTADINAVPNGVVELKYAARVESSPLYYEYGSILIYIV